VLVAAPACLATAVGCASLGGLNARDTPTTMALACGEQYVWIPAEERVVLEIPAGNCWSHWATVPQEATSLALRPDGVLDVQLAFADGTTVSYTDVAPTRRMPDVERATGVRYRNRQARAVRVEVVLE
jgi:hypothetical protein